jgi:hypothetical protein
MILERIAFLKTNQVKKFLFFFLLFLQITSLLAQQDTARNVTSKNDAVVKPSPPDTTSLYYSTPEEQRLARGYANPKDNSLDNLNNYYQMGVLGNIGLPSYSLIAENNLSGGFFKAFNLNNGRDLFNNSEPVYFQPSGKIYTKVFAAMGQKQEQVFKILHSQKIKQVNISLAFNRYSCLGFYNFQKTLTDNLIASSHAKTKNGRMGYNFHFLFNKLKYQLNGGIDTNQVNFDKNVLIDKQLFPVNLSAARQNIRTAETNLGFFFRFNKDSMNVEHYLAYEGNYQSSYWLYADGAADSAWYSHTDFYNKTTGSSLDSISMKRFSNSFLYKLKTRRLAFYAGYKSEFNHYNQIYYDTVALNHLVTSGVNFSTKKHHFDASGEYAFAGPNAGNYLARGAYYFNALDKFHAGLSANAASQMPAYMSQYYFAPHFSWAHKFGNIATQNIRLTLGIPRYRLYLGAFVQSQQSPVYFDTFALPQQYNGSTLITRFFLKDNLRLWHLRFNNELNYQTTPNTDIIRLPQLYTFHQLYYEGKLFKNALWLQAGVQARYISSFKANAYMPATNQFYLQDQKEYGNYVFVDVFVNARIDKFSFFLMASHINQGYSGSNYMLCPTYAMPDRSLKAGLSWMFFD